VYTAQTSADFALHSNSDTANQETKE